MKTLFFRLLDTDNKGDAMRTLVRAPSSNSVTTFTVPIELLSELPQASFAYWISPAIRDLFAHSPTFSTVAETRRGMSSLDDFRFVRTTWEVAEDTEGWEYYSKGDTYRPFYESFASVVNYHDDGHEAKAYVEEKVGSASRTIQAQEWYFTPGLTWVRRTHRLCMRVMPKNVIFSGGAQAAFTKQHRDQEGDLLSLLGLASSSAFDSFAKIGVGRTGDAVQFEPGMVSRVPLPPVPYAAEKISSIVRQAWLCNWRLDEASETSPAFILPGVLLHRSEVGEPLTESWIRFVEGVAGELRTFQADIDAHYFHAYGIGADDQASISSGYSGSATPTNPMEISDGEVVKVTEVKVTPADAIAELLSWAIGVAFGRFDPRLATGIVRSAQEPGPFDALPKSSPARSVGRSDDPGRLAFRVDESGHPEDLATLVQQTLLGLGIEVESSILGTTIREWIRTSFFQLHIKMYSRSRRKAPIWWQLSTQSSKYSVWLSFRQLSKDTLFRVQNEYLAPKLAHEQRTLERLRADLDGNDSASANTIEDQENLVAELQVMLDEMMRVAPLWNPDLNDGVIINYAPLWRLVPQNRIWQKELRATWAALCAGDYEWTHLAMHLWPERVVPKCQVERSLAIAHGLEDNFWTEENGKWKPRTVPFRSVDNLISERTLPAVKAALKSLLEAPDPIAATKRGRRSKTR